MKLDLTVFFSKDNLTKIKNGAHAINLDDKKNVKEHTEFHYLLTKT